jgi:2-dehydro-3-deoxygalactonokinase
MRGEETQVWGSGALRSGLCVLPGTHSKWVGREADGSLTQFRTYMTGELFAVLSQHSILGRLMERGPYLEDAFLTGVHRGWENPAHATHVLFSVRTAGLMGNLGPDCLADFLSGLLIGMELASALELFKTGDGSAGPADICFIGDEALCARYVAAWNCVAPSDCPVVVQKGHDASERGLWNIARAAGLLG